MNFPPPLIADAPPLLPASNRLRNSFAILLSLCLALFLADATASVLDDLLIVFFGLHIFSLLRAIVGIFALLMALGVYGLIGLTPMVPKRLFVPIPLFQLAASLALFPLAIYFFGWMQQISLCLSIIQVIVGLGILYWCRGGFKLRWPLVPVDKLGARGFSWWNLSGFVLVNMVLLPAVIIYCFFCTALTVHHFSGGFMALHPGGLTVQVRKYVRSDGKTIELFPMSHIADARFYQKVARTFPTNSIILMEGVTDKENLLTNKISYKRAATALGLSEQKTEFVPVNGEIVRADVDVDQFSSDTIACLNLIMLIHSKGLTLENLQKLMQFSAPSYFQDEFMDDLLTKRNQHVVEEIKSHLTETDNIMVPWGVAHMPGIAGEIQKAGFRLDSTQDYVVVQFRRRGNP